MASLLAVSAPPVEVRTVSGKVVAGELTQIGADGVTLTVAGKPSTFAAADVLDLQFSPANAKREKPAVWIELTDGSLLQGSAFTATKSAAQLTVAGQPLELPTKAIRRILFTDPAELSPRWAQVEGVKRSTDLLALRKKETLDFLEGVVGDIETDEVKFQLDGDAVSIKRSRIDGILLFQRPVEYPDPLAAVTDAAGNRLAAKSLTLADGKLTVTTLSGVKLDRPIEQLKRIDYSAGKISYLGDLPLDSSQSGGFLDFSKSAPTLSQFYRPRVDRGVEGPLRLGGKTYAKGLSVTSPATLVYRLPAKARQFQALAGIDDAFRDGGGTLRLEIFGDTTSLLSAKLAAGDKPRPIDLDVSKYRRLKIVVEYGDDLDFGDHLDLCDARVLK